MTEQMETNVAVPENIGVSQYFPAWRSDVSMTEI